MVTDLVVKQKVLDFKGILDFKEFLEHMKEFFENYNYSIKEEKYSTVTKEGLKTTKLNWDCDRKYDDYNEAHIKIEIELNDYKEGSKKGKKLVEGELKVKIKGEMKRDYDNKWKTNSLKIFMRGLYDKYVVNLKEGGADSELKDVIGSFADEFKKYLQI